LTPILTCAWVQFVDFAESICGSRDDHRAGFDDGDREPPDRAALGPDRDAGHREIEAIREQRAIQVGPAKRDERDLEPALLRVGSSQRDVEALEIRVLRVDPEAERRVVAARPHAQDLGRCACACKRTDDQDAEPSRTRAARGGGRAARCAAQSLGGIGCHFSPGARVAEQTHRASRLTLGGQFPNLPPSLGF